MSEKKLKIAYLTSSDARDKRSWSGTHYYMAKSLEKHIGEIDYLGPVDFPFDIFKGRVISFITQKLLGKRYDYLHSLSIAKNYSKIFSEKLKNKNYDLIFAPASSSKIAFIETDVPIVYLSDSTFSNMLNYYSFYSNLLKKSVKSGNEIERRALSNSAFALFPSEWAANSAIKFYNTDKSKVHVIPFGANIDSYPTKETILQKKKNKVCRLLFLGVEWGRKGGDIAFNTMLDLNDMGIETELIVCGCIPPKNIVSNKLDVIHYINKNIEAEYEKFNKLLLESDFLILPTKAECYGIVFCEASAYGLPVIAANTGGVAGAVENNENGVLLPVTANSNDYAKVISEIFSDDKKYYSLVNKSRSLFETLLNWDAWALEVKKIITPIVKA